MMERLGDILEREAGIVLRPIPTEYRGVTYRSRLEARWAVFFDQLRIEHAYEYEGFQLESGWYLPDFWLPELNTWLEIKPSEPPCDGSEMQKCYELVQSPARGLVALAYEGFAFRDPEPNIIAWWADDGKGNPGVDQPYMFCDCPECHRIGIEFEGRGSRVCGARCCPDTDRGCEGYGPRFVAAHQAARTWRFW